MRRAGPGWAIAQPAAAAAGSAVRLAIAQRQDAAGPLGEGAAAAAAEEQQSAAPAGEVHVPSA